jgi:catechol 2,3-dioxygenase-like lactoylglutathione lyase family enzyme
MKGIVGTSLVAQVGFIVKDVEATKAKWAEFLGVEAPPTVDCGNYETTQTIYKGKPAPKANCLMAFFDVGPSMQLELIQPNEEPSTWRDYLESHGEGVHHLAFQVKGTDAVVKSCEGFGLTLVQQATYGDGSGKYSYLEAQDQLKCLVELLESFN